VRTGSVGVRAACSRGGFDEPGPGRVGGFQSASCCWWGYVVFMSSRSLLRSVVENQGVCCKSLPVRRLQQFVRQKAAELFLNLLRQKPGGAAECMGIVGGGVYVVCYIILVR